MNRELLSRNLSCSLFSALNGFICGLSSPKGANYFTQRTPSTLWFLSQMYPDFFSPTSIESLFLD